MGQTRAPARRSGIRIAQDRLERLAFFRHFRASSGLRTAAGPLFQRGRRRRQNLGCGAFRVERLAVSGWVAFTVVPALARRTPLQWLAYRMDYRVTREGVVYLAGIFIVALAALNTGNNLLFMTLACLLAGILVSGVVSQTVLSGVELRLDLPEHIFAAQPVLALAELVNHKNLLPSFSLRLVGTRPSGLRREAGSTSRAAGADSSTGIRALLKSKRAALPANEILTAPVYFPY